MLRTTGHRAAEDPGRWCSDAAETWIKVDESGIDTACGFSTVPRWVSVNDQCATGVLCGLSSRPGLHLVLLDTEENQIAPHRSIAGAWYGDNGMSMVGGTSGQSLSLVAPSVVLQTVDGDASGPRGVILWPDMTNARAARVVRWVDEIEGHVSAALSLADSPPPG